MEFKEESEDEMDLLSRIKSRKLRTNAYSKRDDEIRKKKKKRNRIIGQKSWRCERCQEVFYDTKLWQRHKHQKDCTFEPLPKKWSGPPKNPYKLRTHPCKYCEETFKTLKLLKIHKQTHKPELDEPEQEQPTYKFDNVQDLYICGVCSAEFQEESEVKEHIKTHQEVIACSVCQETFKTYFDLGMHSARHDPEHKVHCPLCSYVSSNPNPYSFKSHVTYVHLKKFPFYCKDCGKGFKQYKTFKEHQNSHSGQRPYVCVVCQKGFTYQKYLQVHQMRNHQVGITGNKIENECRTCNRYFYKPAALKEHMKVCYKKAKKVKSETPVKAFLCDSCGQTFTEKAKLLEHLRVHRGDLPFVCSWCGKRFPVKAYLKTHERVHTGEKPYSCEFCGKRFGQHAPFRIKIEVHSLDYKLRRSTRRIKKRNTQKPESDDELDKQDIVNNRKTKNGAKTWHCDLCQEVFQKIKLYQQHKTKSNCIFTPIEIKKEKSTKRPHRDKQWHCKYCHEPFQTQKLLRDHKRSHRAEDIKEEDPSYKFDELQDLYICEVCCAEFQTQAEAEEHVKSHTPGIKCIDCSEWFKTPFDLGMHSMVHDKNKKIKCPLCKYVSKSTNQYSFKAHLNYMHLKKFPFYCKECGKGFKQYKTYHEHQNTHNGTRPFICIVCEKSFTFEKYLVVHQVRNHQVGTTGSRIENECKRCHRYFKNSQSMYEHLEDCNKKRKNLKKPNSFLCDTCGQGFIEKAKLLKHIRVHVGDLPFACKWCGKKFPQKDYLKTHERVHTGEKPYSCEFCGKRFGFHAPFRVHIRTHTGERPYVCNFCQKGFTTNQGLKLHKKNCPENQLNKMLSAEGAGYLIIK